MQHCRLPCLMAAKPVDWLYRYFLLTIKLVFGLHRAKGGSQVLAADLVIYLPDGCFH